MFKRNPYLWEVEFREAFDESQESFISTAMTENLNHARHIENERMSLLVGITALIAGILSIGGSFISQALNDAREGDGLLPLIELGTVFLIFIVVLDILILARKLNKRWNMAFDRHMYYAKSCYFLLHRSNFELVDQGKAESFEQLPDSLAVKECTEAESDRISKTAFKEAFRIKAFETKLTDVDKQPRIRELMAMPLYCFDINKNVDEDNTVDTRSTKKYFTTFYDVLIGIVMLMMLIIAVMAIVYAIGYFGG
ncbi:MAG: hypothetical protein KBS68_02820 [Clostridiales bacterium]|nr:hypothetical protein [Candidatus Crickella merdequi]